MENGEISNNMLIKGEKGAGILAELNCKNLNFTHI